MRVRRRIPVRADATLPSGGDQPAPACHAPFTSMHLDPRGHVRACCMNEWQSLGVIGATGLRDIWDGAGVQRLRDELAAGSFELGCERCATHVAAGTPEQAYLTVFDRFPAQSAAPPWPRQLELALSNTCNLQCVMCNGDLSSAIRSRREHRPPLPEVYDDAFFDELRDFLPHLDAITFLGGEPFLARESLRVFSLLTELGLTPACHVTTNGTQWNQRIAAIVSSLPVHVAVSIDALSADLASSIRVGVDHHAVLANIERFQAATADGPGGVSLSYCLMRTNWQEFGAVLDWADRRDLDVTVNPVVYPPRFSLAHAPTAELRHVLAELEAESPSRSAVRRNAGVWSAQVATLRAQLAEREDLEGTEDAGDAVERLRQLVASEDAAWSATWITTDVDEMVVLVEPPGPLLGVLVGRPLREMVDRLTAELGPVASSHVERRAGGTEVRDLVFRRDGRDTVVRAAMAPTPEGGQRWWIGVAEPGR